MNKFVLLIIIFFVYGCSNASVDRQSDQQWIDQGREVYLNHGCAVCHGADGYGDGLAAARYYPPPTNFYDVTTYRFGSSINEIKAIIRNGVPEEGSAMPAFDHLSKQELKALSLYIQSLQYSEELQEAKEE